MDANPFMQTHIEAEKYVMIRLPSENFRVVQLARGGTLSLGKFGSFKVDAILGHPFGHTYEITKNESGNEVVRPINNDFEIDNADEEAKEEKEIKEITELRPDENNRLLFDDPSVQAMSMADIEALKKEGLSGQDLINKVMESHASFDKKTTFSKEKYLKRKQQKFLQQFTPQAITSSELLDIYTDKDVARIQNLTTETLGYIMSTANARPGGKYLVVDDVSGVLVAALLERMGGQGTIVVAHENEHPNLDSLKYLNLPQDLIDKCVKKINWLDFLHPEEAEVDVEFKEKTPEQIAALRQNQRGQYYRKKQRYDDYKIARSIIDSSDFDACIVATDLFLPSLMPKLVPALAGSKPLVIYSEYKELLVETTNMFQKDLRVIAPTIVETRVRKYQTLPGRFHPHMTSRGGGGYILWGLKVWPSEVTAATANRGKKQKTKHTSSAPAEAETTPVSNETDVN